MDEPDEKSVKIFSRRFTIRNHIEESGELFRREDYELPTTRRRARANPLATTLNALAKRRGHSK
jgi:hypothetical protein